MTELWAGRAPAGVRAVGDPVATPVPQALREALAAGPGAVNALLLAHDPPTLSRASENYGSGGSHVHSSAPEVDDFFEALFDHVAALPLGVRIDRQDLYHGHIFACGPDGARGPRGGELGVLFHAKEHPTDIPDGKGGGSGFSTQSPTYGDRNILYLASTGRTYVIDPRGENHVLLANLENAAFIPPAFAPERVKAVDESGFSELGARLPDVNLLPEDLGRRGSPRALFFKGYSAPDAEALPVAPVDTAEDRLERESQRQRLAKALGTFSPGGCALDAKSDPPPGPDDPGTGAGGFGGTFDPLSIRCL